MNAESNDPESDLLSRLAAERTAFADLLAQTPVATAVMRGPELVFVMANPAFVEVAAGRDILGKPLLEAMPEVTGQGFDDLLRGVMRTGQAHVGNETLIKLDRCGRIEDTYFNFIYAPLRNAAGDIDSATVVAVEVTEQVLSRKKIEALAAEANAELHERRRAEEALRESEERYRTLFASAPMAVFVCDRNAVIQQYNRRAAELWGREPVRGVEQHCGSVKLWLTDGTLLPHAQSPMMEVLRTGIPASNVEVFIERPDGSRLPVLVNFAALKDPEGKITGAITSFTDITERKQAEQALRASEDRFRAVADNIPQLAWMADREGWVGWFNRGWLEYTGTTLEDNQGLGWKAVHHPDHVDAVAEKFIRHLREGLDWEDTFPLRGKDGRYRWFLSRMKAIRDDSGTVMGFFGTNTDVTEQRAAEESLKEADRRKDEFLATLSHELRNPLAPIRNAVHLLRDADDDPQIRAQARGILERQVGHTIRLVDDLLELSRITLGTIALEKQRVALAEVVDSAIETSRPHIDAAGHRFETRIAERPVMLNADPVRLAQVIANVLNNAAKYTPRGGLITLEARGEGGAALVSVRDNGAGIPAGMLERIFDTFARVDTSLHRAGGGLGIGLSLSKKLIEMHGGSIEARSGGLGKGSEIVLRVPALASDQPAVSGVALPTQAAAPRRVLVVDDNVDAAESLGMLLKQMGHEVRLAHDGRAALEAAQHNPPEIILLDIGLPKIDGYGVAEQLRKDHRFQHVRVVALSGYGQDGDRKRSREAGFDEHLVKPVDPATLRSVIERAAAL